MQLFPYRKETDPELIAAARAAYREAPPQRNTAHSRFGRTVRGDDAHRYEGPADVVERGDAA